LRVLLAPTRPDHASAVALEYLRDVYASLRTMCDFVIVDTPSAFTPEVIATIDVSTAACMVGMLDSASLKTTKLGLETLELMGYPSENVTFVLNRADTRVGITTDEVTANVGRPPDVEIPSDPEIPPSLTEGTPVVWSRGQSESARAFEKLADRYAARSSERPSPQRPPMELHGQRRPARAAPVPADPDPFAELKHRVHLAVIRELGPQLDAAAASPDALRERVLADVRDQLAQETGISRDDRRRIAIEIADDILGYGPLERLLADDTVTEIMVKARTRSGSSARGSSTRRARASTTSRTCAGSSARSSRGRARARGDKADP
jgi:hypothetical protein